MRPRIKLARLFIRLGNFIKSLSIMVMRPDDLVEFSRQTYAKQEKVDVFGSSELVDSGLNSEETEILSKVPNRNGHLLLLGVGGGREAFPLIRLGFQVTGVDYVPEMIDQLKRNATKHGLRVQGLVQEMSNLDLQEEAYDVVWLCAEMYSSVPTRKRRINMLRRINKVLKPGGAFVCQFHLDISNRNSTIAEIIKNVLAWVSLGNLSYERGDMLWGSAEFIHGFRNVQDLKKEFIEGGFETTEIILIEKKMRGSAVLKKINIL